MALIPQFFLDCVVGVGFVEKDDKVTYRATGFLYGHFQTRVNEKTRTYKIYLVTNRHVFQGEKKAFLRFNPESGEPAREYNLNLVDADGKQLWLAHEDPDVDVAIAAINVQLLRKHGIRFCWFHSDDHVMPRSKASELGVSEGDGVMVLGFPLGLVGQGRNFVIVRHGVMARIKDCLEANQREFLIDCSVFPGNSGGPVVTRPEAVAIQGTKRVNGAFLVGIVASYVPYEDVAISERTGRPRIIFEENSGLASVFPVDYIQDVVAKAIGKGLQAPTAEESKSQ